MEDRVDPVEDLKIITSELRQKDIDVMQNQIDQLENLKKRGLKKEQQEELDASIRVRGILILCLLWCSSLLDFLFEVDTHNMETLDNH